MDDVTIIIVNWNGKKLLARCLEGLRKQTYKSFSVTLVDNGSDDGSLDFVIENHPEVSVMGLPKNIGFAAANNLALKKVRTKYVALLNNDAVPDPMWIGTLVSAIERHPAAGFAASKMLFYDNRGVIDRAGDGYTRAGTGLMRGRGKPSREFDKEEWVFGACAASAIYRIQMLREIGFFDEDLFLIYEDVDLSFRAQLKGFKCLYVPEACVYHQASSSIIHDSPVSVYYSHRNIEWVYIKNMPLKLLIRTFFNHIIYNMGAFLFFALNGRIRYFIKAKIDAFKGMKKTIQKRGAIQRGIRVNNEYLWSLFDKEYFLPRLTRRIQRTESRVN